MKRSPLRFLFLSPEIRNRLLISIALLVLYRFVAHVPVPGIDRGAIAQVLSGSGQGQTLFGLLRPAFGRHRVKLLCAGDGRIPLYHRADYPSAACTHHPRATAADGGRPA